MQGFSQPIPPGYCLAQITAADVQRFAHLSISLVETDIQTELIGLAIKN